MTPAHERFARWLEWLDLSQSAVAEKLGCTQVMVSYLSRGERDPGLRLAIAIEKEMRAPRSDGKRYRERAIAPGDWVRKEVA